MALTLQALHEALADTIRAGIDRQTNVNAFPDGSDNYPQITIHSDPSNYIDYWATLGSAGYSDLWVRIKIEVDAVDVKSVCIKMLDYLSVGTGNESSIIDAIRANPTLGGVVDDTFPGTAEWDSDSDPRTAWIPAHLLCKKVSAQL